MPPMTDTDRALSWVITRLNSSPTMVAFVGVHPTYKVRQFYRRSSPAGAIRPNIVAKYVSGRPRKTGSGRKMLSTVNVDLIINHTYPNGNMGNGGTTLTQAKAELERLFQQSQFIDDETTIGCSLVQPIEFEDEDEAGTVIIHEGWEISLMIYNNSIQPINDYGV